MNIGGSDSNGGVSSHANYPQYHQPNHQVGSASFSAFSAASEVSDSLIWKRRYADCAAEGERRARDLQFQLQSSLDLCESANASLEGERARGRALQTRIRDLESALAETASLADQEHERAQHEAARALAQENANEALGDRVRESLAHNTSLVAATADTASQVAHVQGRAAAAEAAAASAAARVRSLEAAYRELEEELEAARTEAEGNRLTDAAAISANAALREEVDSLKRLLSADERGAKELQRRLDGRAAAWGRAEAALQAQISTLQGAVAAGARRLEESEKKFESERLALFEEMHTTRTSENTAKRALATAQRSLDLEVARSRETAAAFREAEVRLREASEKELSALLSQLEAARREATEAQTKADTEHAERLRMQTEASALSASFDARVERAAAGKADKIRAALAEQVTAEARKAHSAEAESTRARLLESERAVRSAGERAQTAEEALSAALTSQERALQVEKEEHVFVVNTLQSQIAALHEEVAGLKSHVSQLQRASSAAPSPAAFQALESTLSNKEAALREAEQTLRSVRGSLATSEASLQSMTSQMLTAETSLHSTTSKLQAAESTLQTTASKLQAAESTLQTTASKLQAAESSLKSTSSKLEAAETAQRLAIAREKELARVSSEEGAARTRLEAELAAVREEQLALIAAMTEANISRDAEYAEALERLTLELAEYRNIAENAASAPPSSSLGGGGASGGSTSRAGQTGPAWQRPTDKSFAPSFEAIRQDAERKRPSADLLELLAGIESSSSSSSSPSPIKRHLRVDVEPAAAAASASSASAAIGVRQSDAHSPPSPPPTPLSPGGTRRASAPPPVHAEEDDDSDGGEGQTSGAHSHHHQHQHHRGGDRHVGFFPSPAATNEVPRGTAAESPSPSYYYASDLQSSSSSASSSLSPPARNQQGGVTGPPPSSAKTANASNSEISFSISPTSPVPTIGSGFSTSSPTPSSSASSAASAAFASSKSPSAMGSGGGVGLLRRGSMSAVKASLTTLMETDQELAPTLKMAQSTPEIGIKDTNAQFQNKVRRRPSSIAFKVGGNESSSSSSQHQVHSLSSPDASTSTAAARERDEEESRGEAAPSEGGSSLRRRSSVLGFAGSLSRKPHQLTSPLGTDATGVSSSLVSSSSSFSASSSAAPSTATPSFYRKASISASSGLLSAAMLIEETPRALQKGDWEGGGRGRSRSPTISGRGSIRVAPISPRDEDEGDEDEDEVVGVYREEGEGRRGGGALSFSGKLVGGSYTLGTHSTVFPVGNVRDQVGCASVLYAACVAVLRAAEEEMAGARGGGAMAKFLSSPATAFSPNRSRGRSPSYLAGEEGAAVANYHHSHSADDRKAVTLIYTHVNPGRPSPTQRAPVLQRSAVDGEVKSMLFPMQPSPNIVHSAPRLLALAAGRQLRVVETLERFKEHLGSGANAEAYTSASVLIQAVTQYATAICDWSSELVQSGSLTHMQAERLVEVPLRQDSFVEASICQDDEVEVMRDDALTVRAPGGPPIRITALLPLPGGAVAALRERSEPLEPVAASSRSRSAHSRGTYGGKHRKSHLYEAPTALDVVNGGLKVAAQLIFNQP